MDTLMGGGKDGGLRPDRIDAFFFESFAGAALVHFELGFKSAVHVRQRGAPTKPRTRKWGKPERIKTRF